MANALTRRCGLDDKAVFKQASALALPFEAETSFATLQKGTIAPVEMIARAV